MCTQSSLAASLIKRAHGANKKLFCEFFGFFPMSKEQRKEGRQRRLPLSLYSSTLFRGPMSICTLSDALRGFDLHLIPSTKELTCLCLVLWFQFFSFSVSLKILTHTHIAIACTESPTFAAALWIREQKIFSFGPRYNTHITMQIRNACGFSFFRRILACNTAYVYTRIQLIQIVMHLRAFVPYRRADALFQAHWAAGHSKKKESLHCTNTYVLHACIAPKKRKKRLVLHRICIKHG